MRGILCIFLCLGGCTSQLATELPEGEVGREQGALFLKLNFSPTTNEKWWNNPLLTVEDMAPAKAQLDASIASNLSSIEFPAKPDVNAARSMGERKASIVASAAKLKRFIEENTSDSGTLEVVDSERVVAVLEGKHAVDTQLERVYPGFDEYQGMLEGAKAAESELSLGQVVLDRLTDQQQVAALNPMEVIGAESVIRGLVSDFLVQATFKSSYMEKTTYWVGPEL